MPLTPRAASHIKAKLALMWEGRTQPIVFTLRTVTGGVPGTTTLTVDAVWHVNDDADPAYSETAGRRPLPDILAMVNAADITLAQLRSCLYAAPQSLLANEPATRYLITAIQPKGTMAGGDRYMLTLARQR